MLNENKLENYSLLIARKNSIPDLWIKVINLKYKIKLRLKDNVRRMPKCNTHIDINKIMIKMKLGFYIIFFSFHLSSIPNKNIKHNETL